MDLETQPPVVKHLRSCTEQERCDMDQGYTTEGWTRWAAWGCTPSRGQGKPASNWFLLVHLPLATTLESSAVFCAPQPQTLRIPITICRTHTYLYMKKILHGTIYVHTYTIFYAYIRGTMESSVSRSRSSREGRLG